MKIKNTKWCLIFVFVILGIILFKITLGNTFLFSRDGWNPIERQINSNNVVVKGGGNEPGWNVVVRGETFNHSDFSVDLSLDYGEYNWSGILTKTWQEDYSNQFQFRGDVNLMNKDSSINEQKKNVIVFFEKKACADDADVKHDWTVELNFNSEKSYEGCADFVSK
jgi:uncharacterized membrane protein